MAAPGGTVLPAPATATPARNLRRLNFASLSLRIIAPFRLSGRRSRHRFAHVGGTIAWVYGDTRHANVAWANSRRRIGKTKAGPARAPLRLSAFGDLRRNQFARPVVAGVPADLALSEFRA